MQLDEHARRATEELTEAGRQARFTVRSPAIDSRVSWPTVAVATLIVAVVIGGPMLWAGNRRTPLGGQPTTSSTSTTSATTTTTSTVARTPAARVDELVTALYAALNAGDDDAIRALTVDGAQHSTYVAELESAEVTSTFAHDDYRHASTGIGQIEITGTPIESGDSVTVPVRYTYPATQRVYDGFDVLVLARLPDGVLIAGGATFLGAPGLAVHPTASEVIDAERTAWNGDDRDGVLALFADEGALWDDLTDPDALFIGDGLWALVAGSLWFDVEFAAEPITSGPFLAIPTRLVATRDTSEGVTIYYVRNGQIQLQAFAQ